MYGPYKEHYACFTCRKAFKQTIRWELSSASQPAVGETRVCHCPQCGQAMVDMGLDFKAPKQKDVKQWQKVQLLYSHGFTFHSCGCCGPGLRPAELKDVEAFLANTLPRSAGEALLAKINAYARTRKR